MSAFRPGAWEGVAAVAALCVIVLLIGYAVTRMRHAPAARAAAWGLALLAGSCAHALTRGDPPGVRMLALVATLLLAMKVVVAVEALAAEGTALAFARWLAFACLWPGMRPALFADPRVVRDPRALVSRGTARVLAGAALIVLARRIWEQTGSLVAASCALLPGLSLLVHFGVFNVAAGLWRRWGVDAEPLFRAPLRARSLAEFWSRRWNVAFSEMTALAVYRPVSAAFGRPTGIMASFVLSGLLHEAAISVPVDAGYGGPLCFFVLHGLLSLEEKDRGAFGRAATLAAVVLPLPALFHRPFLDGVIRPLLV